MRSRTRRRFTRGTRTLKSGIWIPALVNFSATETSGNQTLIDPTDWEQQFGGNAFERATLTRIVGWIGYNQTANATAGGQTIINCMILKRAFAESAAADPVLLTELGERDILRVFGRPLATTAATATPSVQIVDQIDIKTKRKLDSSEVIDIVGRVNTDAASPACQVVGVLRLRVDRG